MQENKPEFDVPAKGESWTADQLAKYLGLTYNESFGEEGQPPYVLETRGAIVAATREQIVQAFKVASTARMQPQPSIVVPGVVMPGRQG